MTLLAKVARRVWALACAMTLLALAPGRGLAHGGVTGMQDVVQDYGVLVFLAAVVLIGAGVLAWVMLSPQPDETGDEDGTAP